MMKQDQLYFVGLKAFIAKDGKVLLLNDPQMGADMPGGKIQEGETDFSEILKREVREETGLEIEVEEPFYAWHFQIPVNSGHRSAGKMIFNVAYSCRYISGDISLSAEHDRYDWVDKDTYGKFTVNSNLKKTLDYYFLLRHSEEPA